MLSIDEVAAVLSHPEGVHWMVAALLYGSGLRLSEAITLRVKDFDFPHRADVRTTQIYTHVLQRGGRAVISALGAAVSHSCR